MRAPCGFLLLVLAGCYDPDLERCVVRCSIGSDACPDDMTCGTDDRCHAAGDNETCAQNQMFTLTVDSAGTGNGIVSAAPDINCPPTCSESVSSGAVVELDASPGASSRFVSWGGSCTGSDTSCSVTVSSDVIVGANFNLLDTITVELTGNGGGDVVALQPAGLVLDCDLDNAPCTVSWDDGASITLSAEPDDQSVFDGWGGDCEESTGQTCTLVLSGPITAIAEFDQ
jgi:Divergent InlB B-repeat domain